VKLLSSSQDNQRLEEEHISHVSRGKHGYVQEDLLGLATSSLTQKGTFSAKKRQKQTPLTGGRSAAEF
jgi:hypothetical protein